MKTVEREVGGMHITEQTTELFCPLAGEMCLADRCAIAVCTDSRESSTWYCGLVATSESTHWNEGGFKPINANWVKSVTREAQDGAM